MVTRPKKRPPILLGALLLLAVLPAFLHGNGRIMHALILSLVWGGVAASWDLMLGYARIFSFGQIALFTAGGYTSAMLAMQVGISPWVGILVGGFAACAIGFVIALPCLRLRGVYVAVVTFALQLAMPIFLMYGGPFTTGGSYGLLGIPPLQVGGYTFSRNELVPWYYVAFGIFAGTSFAIYKIINSKLGLAFMALRDAEPFAISLGVDEYRHSLILFGISAFISGIFGAFYAHYIGIISPVILGLDIFLLVLIMIMLGGMGRFPGAIVGAFVVTFINDALIPTGPFRLLILGAIVVVVMIYFPQGLMGIPEYSVRLIKQIRKNRN